MISLTPLQPLGAAPAAPPPAAEVVRTILRCAWERPKTERNLTSLTKR